MGRVNMEKIMAERRAFHESRKALLRKAHCVVMNSKRWQQRQMADELTKDDMQLFNRALKEFKKTDEYKQLLAMLTGGKVKWSNAQNVIYRIFSEGFFAMRACNPVTDEDGYSNNSNYNNGNT